MRLRRGVRDGALGLKHGIMLQHPKLRGQKMLVHAHDDVMDAYRISFGVYANQEPDEERRFGEQTQMFVELSAYGREQGVDVVVLTPGYSTSKRGWRYDPDDRRWRQMFVPLPDVVLRRSGTFRHVSPNLVKTDLVYLKSEGRLHSLPRECSNKWTFHRIMHESSDLRKYLPVTQLATSATDIIRFLRLHKDVYVKPLNGAQGVFIHRLTWRNRLPVAVWEQHPSSLGPSSSLRTEVMEREFPNETSFSQYWSEHGLKRCIVQETIAVPRTPDGRPFDFRWLVQFTDHPKVMARVARVGQPNSVTTNIHTGGRAVPAERMLRYCTAKDVEHLVDALDDAALSVASRLRKVYGPFAEVGVDLAARGGGDVVVFEVNPTPGRRMLRSLSGNVREMSLRTLVEYAIRATGIEGGKRE